MRRQYMTEDINNILLAHGKDWLKYCNTEELAKRYPLSKAFCFGVTNEYIKSDFRAMIVGQEAYDFGSYSGKWSIEDIQMFNIDYVSTQLGYEKKYKYNPSPFWNMFRRIKKAGFEPCWNNIDKFHQIQNNGDKDITVPLSVEIEHKVDIPYGNDKKSLLIREIEIARPDVILFAIGPNYDKALAFSLDRDESDLIVYKPDKQNPCKELPESVTNMECHVFWSYHPTYLNRVGKFSETADLISGLIK